MNGGNRDRGQADGFGLEILNRLKDVKGGNDSSVNLLGFVVKIYINKCVGNVDSIENITFPLVEPADIEKCSLVVFSQIDEELSQLSAMIKKTDKLVASIIDSNQSGSNFETKNDCLEHVNVFKEKIQLAKQRTAEQEDSLRECRRV